MILGDEILAVNGTPLQGLSHAEAIQVFKSIRNGHVVIHAARRDVANKRWLIFPPINFIFVKFTNISIYHSLFELQQIQIVRWSRSWKLNNSLVWFRSNNRRWFHQKLLLFFFVCINDNTVNTVFTDFGKK